MPNIQLQIGNFVFTDMEVPSEIPFGGAQRLAVKKLLGGGRVIDAQGDDPIPLAWTGTIFPLPGGATALQRAQTLNQMKAAGIPVTLSWDELHYLVIIREFLPVYQFFKIPYRISCEIIQDLTAPITSVSAPDADTDIASDMSNATGLSDQVGDSVLGGLMDTLNTAVSAVSSFATAAQSEIASVLQPLNAVRQQVGALIASSENTLLNVSTVGGLIPGNPIAAAVSDFLTMSSAASQQPILLQLSGTLGRVSVNLNLVNSSTRVITVAGGNLFDIASREYGDPLGWTAIADANGLTDPSISGISSLVIPPYNSASGGILLA